MRKIKIHDTKPGMVLSKPVYNPSGDVLLEKGISLKRNYINNLKKHHIQNVYIDIDCRMNKENDYTEREPSGGLISEQTRAQAVTTVRQVMEDIRAGNTFSQESVRSCVVTIMDDLLSATTAIRVLTDLKKTDEYTFSHSVNVCTISLGIGIDIGLDRKQLEELGIGALLHDIGKTKIPVDILNKPTPLTRKEYQLIKEHCKYGFDILVENNTSERISYIALYHHEKYDGSGYPAKIKFDEIPLFSRIVTIADVYDALTTNRIYRAGIPAYKVVEFIISFSNYQFDYSLVRTFIKNLAIYPTGSFVILSTGEKGFIIGQNENYPTRPLIGFIEDEKGNQAENIYDLMVHPSMFIKEML